MLRGMQGPPNPAHQMMGCLDNALLCEPCVTASVHLAQAFPSMLLQQGCNGMYQHSSAQSTLGCR